MVVLHATEQSRCRGIALAMLSGAYPDAEVRMKHSTTIIVLPDGRKVSADEAYAPCGTLVLDIPAIALDGEPAQYAQAALVELAKNASCMRQVDMSRRGIVMHNIDRLADHLQHAMRKIVEASSTSAMFVLTTSKVGCLDAALLSRAVVVNCNPTLARADTLEETPAATTALGRVIEAARAAAQGSSKVSQREFGRHHRALVRLMAAQRASTFVTAIDWASRNDTHNVHDLIETAARADHLAVMMPGCGQGNELAARLLLSCLLIEDPRE
jgi:DNA polymerase III delta prime subunit